MAKVPRGEDLSGPYPQPMEPKDGSRDTFCRTGACRGRHDLGYEQSTTSTSHLRRSKPSSSEYRGGLAVCKTVAWTGGYDHRDTEASVGDRGITPPIRRRGEPPLLGHVKGEARRWSWSVPTPGLPIPHFADAVGANRGAHYLGLLLLCGLIALEQAQRHLQDRLFDSGTFRASLWCASPTGPPLPVVTPASAAANSSG